MISLIGILIVFGAIVGGYLMEHGKLLVLVQPAELLIIFGSAIGTVIIANPLPDVEAHRQWDDRRLLRRKVHQSRSTPTT